MFAKRIGIDLGTANVLVYVPKQGIVINEPSVVAVTDDNRVMAVGEEAKEMVGRTPDTITAYRPLRDGVIADYRVTEAMIRYFINKVSGAVRLTRPEVMISVPAGATSTPPNKPGLRKHILYPNQSLLQSGQTSQLIRLLEIWLLILGEERPRSPLSRLAVSLPRTPSELGAISWIRPFLIILGRSTDWP
jgi:hypothetical protein